MKRRGGGGGGSSSTESFERRNVADVDDRQLSAEAQQRAQRKAAAEGNGRQPSAAAAQPMPLGLMFGAATLVIFMVYLTLKFS